MIKQCQSDIQDLQDRPVVDGGPNIDMGLLVSREQYESLMRRVELVEKRNLE